MFGKEEERRMETVDEFTLLMVHDRSGKQPRAKPESETEIPMLVKTLVEMLRTEMAMGD